MVAPFLVINVTAPSNTLLPTLSILAILSTSPLAEQFKGGTKNIPWLAAAANPELYTFPVP